MGHVLKDEEFDLILDPRFLEPGDAVLLLQALHHRLLDDALAVGEGGESALDGVALHGEGIGAADPVLPRKGLDSVEQLGKAGGGESPQVDKDPLGTAQVDVGAGDIRLGALKGHTTVHGVQAFESQAVDLLSQELFQAEHTGGHKCQFHFGSFRIGAQVRIPRSHNLHKAFSFFQIFRPLVNTFVLYNKRVTKRNDRNGLRPLAHSRTAVCDGGLSQASRTVVTAPTSRSRVEFAVPNGFLQRLQPRQAEGKTGKGSTVKGSHSVPRGSVHVP